MDTHLPIPGVYVNLLEGTMFQKIFPMIEEYYLGIYLYNYI